MIKRLLLCLFLLVPITAQAGITEDQSKSPSWITKCWDPIDGTSKILATFEHYDSSAPSFSAATWIRIWEKKTDQWTWIFSFGDNLVCKMEKVLE